MKSVHAFLATQITSKSDQISRVLSGHFPKNVSSFIKPSSHPVNNELKFHRSVAFLPSWEESKSSTSDSVLTDIFTYEQPYINWDKTYGSASMVYWTWKRYTHPKMFRKYSNRFVCLVKELLLVLFCTLNVF